MASHHSRVVYEWSVFRIREKHGQVWRRRTAGEPARTGAHSWLTRFGFFVSYFPAVNLSLCIGAVAKRSQASAESAEMDMSKRMLILYLTCSLGPVSINTLSFYPVFHVISHRRKKSSQVGNTPSPQTNCQVHGYKVSFSFFFFSLKIFAFQIWSHVKLCWQKNRLR